MEYITMNDRNHAKPVYDNYEISGCRELDDGAGRYVETCVDSEAQFWTLYGHINGQGVEAIGDFSSREAAEEAHYRITGSPYTGENEAARLRLMHAAPNLRDALRAALPFVQKWSDWVYQCEDYGEKSDQIDRQHARMLEAYTEATGRRKEEILAAIGIEHLMQADLFIFDELDERIAKPEYLHTVPDGFNPVVGHDWSRLTQANQKFALRSDVSSGQELSHFRGAS
jgi:hypothetical protein